ncbi:hypothetical protein ABIB05_003166 [Bradyrhizobium sp. LB5.2]
MLIQIAIAAFILSALVQDRTLILGSLAGLGAALCVS